MKTIIIWIVVGVVAVGLGVGARVMFKGQNAGVPGKPAVAALDSSEPMRCELTAPSGSSKTVYYITKDWIRQETKAASPVKMPDISGVGSIGEGYLLIDLSKETLYSWYGGAPYGATMKLTDSYLDGIKNGIAASKCAAWIPDLKLFELPAGVNFTGTTNKAPKKTTTRVPNPIYTGPAVCKSVSQKREKGSETRITYYVHDADGRVREEAEYAGEKNIVIENPIKKEAYLWTVGKNSGTHFGGPKSNPIIEPLGYKEEMHKKLVELGVKETFECKVWTPDLSLFTPPANVQFKDFILK